MMGGGEKRPEASDAPLEERLLLPPLLEWAVAARSADKNRGGGGRTSRKWEKMYLDVLAVCCSVEVALLERLLAPLDDVKTVSVVVPSRTIVVEHDPVSISQSHIVKALNKAGLDASWLALAAACTDALLMLLHGFVAASRLTLDINILMLIAVAGAVVLNDYMEACVIVFFLTTVEWVETLACSKASTEMSSLMSMIPPKVVVVETGEVVNVRDAT